METTGKQVYINTSDVDNDLFGYVYLRNCQHQHTIVVYLCISNGWSDRCYNYTVILTSIPSLTREIDIRN